MFWFAADLFVIFLRVSLLCHKLRDIRAQSMQFLADQYDHLTTACSAHNIMHRLRGRV